MSSAQRERFQFVVSCCVQQLAGIRDGWRDDELHLRLWEDDTGPRLTAREHDRAFLRALDILAGQMMAGQAKQN